METWKPGSTVTWMIDIRDKDGRVIPEPIDAVWIAVSTDADEILAAGILTDYHSQDAQSIKVGRVFLDPQVFLVGKDYARKSIAMIDGEVYISTTYFTIEKAEGVRDGDWQKILH